MFALMPALRVVRAGGHGVDFVAHALYGVVVVLSLGELAQQRRGLSASGARLRRVG
jgi:hypothetical protein